MDLKQRIPTDGLVLGNGFYFSTVMMGSEKYSMMGLVNCNNRISFKKFAEDYSDDGIFEFNISKAVEAGYGEDMIILVLSGAGTIPIKALGKAKKKNSTLIVQDPNSALVKKLPNNVIDYYIQGHVLSPVGISEKITEFFG